MALGKVTRGLNKPCILLIVIAGVERLVFKGVASNLVTYLTDVMKMSNSSAAKFVNYWVGFTWIMPLAVASLADSKWDRYTTVLGFSSLYVAGLLALTLTSVQWLHHTKNNTAPHSFSSLMTTLSLYIISLGQGGYNPSLQAFGADQILLEEDDDQKNKKSLFFQWWYFGVCAGSLLGISVMSYVQDNLGWGLSFTVLTLSMLVSIIMFLLGNRFYKHSDEDNSSRDAGSCSRRSFRDIVVRALKGNSLLKMITGYVPITTRDEDQDHAVVEFELEEKPLCSSSCEEQKEVKKEDDDDDADSRKIKTLLPMWIVLLLFAVIFQQPATFFTKQGMTMKRDITGGFKIPPAALQSAITISIIVLMPLYDTALVPLVTRLLLNGKEKGISVIQRIGVGMFVSVVAMAIAAEVERKRLERGGDGVTMSIFWLLPQYVLLGVSDIFTVVGMQEFFYSEASTRTMGIALYSSVFGVGSFLSALLISAIEYFTRHQSWFSDDMSKARLDKYYWLLAFSSAVSLLAFVLVFRGK